MNMVSRILILGSHYGSYLPVGGTVTGTVDLIARPICSCMQIVSEYSLYLKNKSLVRSVLGMIPGVGSIAIVILNQKERTWIESARSREISISELSVFLSHFQTLLHLRNLDRVREIIQNIRIKESDLSEDGIVALDSFKQEILLENPKLSDLFYFLQSVRRQIAIHTPKETEAGEIEKGQEDRVQVEERFLPPPTTPISKMPSQALPDSASGEWTIV